MSYKRGKFLTFLIVNAKIYQFEGFNNATQPQIHWLGGFIQVGPSLSSFKYGLRPENWISVSPTFQSLRIYIPAP